MRKLLTRKIIQTAIIAVLVICGMFALLYLREPKNLLKGQPLLTEEDAAYNATLKAKAYVAIHRDAFPDADYNAIVPDVNVELIEDGEFSSPVYKVHVVFDVPDVADDPSFEILIDGYSGDTIENSVLN